MADEHYTIRDGKDQPVQVVLRRDKRLRRTSRWERLPDGSLLLRIPARLPKHRVGSLLVQMASQLEKIKKRSGRRSDGGLQQLAEQINQKYFKGEIQWSAIRWVSNMHTRLGSCTRGGPTDGEIRISDKIKSWPDWVVKYVIAHELLHRKYPNHSPAFWNELRAAYPQTDRAHGFVDGMTYAKGYSLDDDAPD